MKRALLVTFGVLVAFVLGAWYGQGRLSTAALREYGQPIRIVYPTSESAFNLKSLKATPYKVVYGNNTYTYETVDGDQDVIVNYGNGMKVYARVTSTTFTEEER